MLLLSYWSQITLQDYDFRPCEARRVADARPDVHPYRAHSSLTESAGSGFKHYWPPKHERP